MEWLTLTAAGLLLVAIALYQKYRLSYWTRRGIPSPTPMPFVGNMGKMLFGRESFSKGMLRLTRGYPDSSYCGVYQWTQPILMVWDPEMAKQIVCKDFSSFHDRGQKVDDQDPLSQHLFNLEGTKWRNLRNKLSPTFTSGKLKLMLPLMREVGNELSSVVAAEAKQAPHREVDVSALLTRFATDVIGTCAFGIQCNCLNDDNNEFLVMSRKLFRMSPMQVLRVLLESIHPKLAELLPFKYIFPAVHHFFLNLMKDTVEHREKNKVERNDFVQLMMQLRDADLGHLDPANHMTLTPGVMAAQAFIFFLAGLDNVSNTVSYILSRLAADPELQERVAQEVRDQIRAHDGELSYQALKKMDLVERVLQEGLRLWGPIGIVFRKCNATTQVGDVLVEKGTAVMIVTDRMHLDENIYPDPKRFDPDRHTAEAKELRHPYAYMPFGEGPRICIAERFALLEMKLALVTMVRDFTFAPGPNFEPEPELDPKTFFPRPLRGFRLSVNPREVQALHGSYEALKYGTLLDGLADLTGGITESISIRQDPTHCSRLLSKLLDMTSLITCTVHTPHGQVRNQPEKLANGIHIGTNYRLYAVERVETLAGEAVQLVKLRHPQGAADVVGAWSRDSLMWDELPAMERDRLTGKHLGDGEFWMSYSDFVKTFSHLEVVHLDSDTARDEPSLHHKNTWQMRLYQGAWQRGVSAGGCRNNPETFHINPQLHLILCEMEEVIISLNQHSIMEPKVIGFTAYSLPKSGSETIGKPFFKKNKSLVNSQYTNSRQVSHRCQLEQGGYLVLPTTFEPGQESSFTLRVYSSKPLKLKLLDTLPTLVKSAVIKAPATLDGKSFSQYEAVFLQLADEHRTVNAFELQELLDACLPNDYIKSCACMEVCRQVVMSLDSTGSGRLKLSDFKDLMCSLKHWQSAFKNHTREKTGILKAERLRDALLEIGFQLSTDVLSILILRYMRKDGTLRFGDFVSAILHLSVAFNIFESKDPLQNGSIKLSLAEWLKSSLMC